MNGNGKHHGSGSGGGQSSNVPPGIKNGWFTETETMWPGQKFSLALEGFSNKSILFQQQTDFQSLLVFCSAQYGNVLVLDGVIQLTERDEFAYHEMMVHIPMCAHPSPRHVLIVGGGDGGALREVCKYDCVEQITVVEIDPVVVQVAREYFANTVSTSFDDPRVTVIHADAAQFVIDKHDCYDVIIADTSDPVGPAESLFQPSFYEAMYSALRHNGIVCVQAECFWIHLELVSDLLACCDDIFDHAEYATTMVPTYPCGQIGFILAAKGRGTCRRPVRPPPEDKNNNNDDAGAATLLKWYSPQMHRAAFVLPPFVTRELEESVTSKSRSNSQGDLFLEEEEESEKEYKCFLAKPPPCVIL